MVAAKRGNVVSVPRTHTEEGHLSVMLCCSSVKECLSWYLVTLGGTTTLPEEEKKEEEHAQIQEREDLLGRDLLGGKGEVLGGDAPSRTETPRRARAPASAWNLSSDPPFLREGVYYWPF